MYREATSQTSGGVTGRARSVRREIWAFLLLALVVLPIVMLGAIAAYGFIVWFMQILFWGPPT